ncbi:hypothetical protein EON65_56145, partial [archaeon]
MASTPAPFTPLAQISPPSGEYLTPLSIGRGRVHVVEKNSPIQTNSSPDFRKVVISSASTASSSSQSSRRRGGSSSGYISSAKSTTTPFLNLTSQRLNKEDVQSLAVAMNAMFDDDEDHSEAEEQVKPTPSPPEVVSTKEIKEETYLDSNVSPTQTDHIHHIVFENSFGSEPPPKEEVNYQALLEQLERSRPSVPRTGMDAYIQSKQICRGGKEQGADDVVNLTKELAKLVFEKDVES